MKYLALSTIILLSFATMSLAGYVSTPAIVQVPKNGQHDSVGFNIVKELPAILYKRILEQEINLYTTPLKDKKRSPEEFMKLEEETGTLFMMMDDLFLDEDWKLQNKKFEFHIRGIFCLNRSKDGQQVNYGYLDLSEIEVILKSLIIPTNSNGSKNLTFWDALHSKRYYFNLVKFGDEDFNKNPERSFELRHEAFTTSRSTNALVLPEVKEVEIALDSVDFNEDKMNSKLYEALSSYFLQNPQEYYNQGGDRYDDFLNRKVPLEITRIVVSETWRRTDKGIQYQLNQITIYINGHALQPLNVSEIRKMGLLVNFTPLEEFLEEKNFFFTILRINEQKVYPHQAGSALNALLTGSWNQIIIEKETEN